MKSMIIYLSIISVFCLTSCNVKVKTKTNSNSTETTESISTTTTETNQEPTETSSTDVSLPDYDDGEDWHGTID